MVGEKSVLSRIQMAMTAVLYFGPLLAGLSGQGWSQIPLFVGVFVLWLAVHKPGKWPQTRDDWAKSEAAVAVLSQIAAQALLIVGLFAVGRGMGGILGYLPLFHPLMPVTLCFVSVPIARLVQSTLPATPAPEAEADALVAAIRVTEPLNGLPASTRPDRLAAHLQAIGGQIGYPALRAALVARAREGKASPAAQAAMVVLATEPAFSKGATASDADALLAALPPDAPILARYAERLQSALDTDSSAARSLAPTAEALLKKAAFVEGTPAAYGLAQLQRRLRAA
jgi:hypothetical protein